jgi:hypothetical protein
LYFSPLYLEQNKWTLGKNALGLSAANDLSLAGAAISFSALMDHIMKVRFIARAHASKRHIDCGAILSEQPSHKTRPKP